MAMPDGGNAFPVGINEEEGMSLRDYFAAQALASIADIHAGRAMDPKATARAAYEIADAMLEARK